ncbi:seminal metalloprotease 1-like [Melitaea cinxia]|uniref:seminal metalloprotease 1-like n=1 Tax=Melitaea cinxia TaxID=113334 RepID=UPI001E274C75|nr:seminal metalloprotease 1-like [Melitaea cinxia]
MILKFVVGLVLVVLTNAAPAAVKYVFDVQQLFADNDILDRYELDESRAQELVETKIKYDLAFVDDVDSSTDAELGEHFEGDMFLSSTQREAIQQAGTTRNGLRNITKRWPNRTVVYHIVEEDFDEKQIDMIENGMADIANKSCLKFRRRVKQEHAVIIQGSASGCYSSVGLRTGDDDSEEEEQDQVLNLEKRCFKHGTVVHEMLHTLGFYHMQSTYDRDDFVQIVYENIKPGAEHNFAKYTVDTVTDFGVPYDYGSVMHYPSKAFSKNGNKTIIPLKEDVKIGQRVGLSESDVLKINRMYCEDEKSVSYVSK